MAENWGINDPLADDTEWLDTWGENDPVIESEQDQQDWGTSDPVVEDGQVPALGAAKPATDIVQQYGEISQRYNEKSNALTQASERFQQLAALPERTPEEEAELATSWKSTLQGQADISKDAVELERLQPQYDKYFADQKQARVDYIESQRGSAVFGNEVADSLYEIDARADLDYEKARAIPDKDKRKEAFAKIKTTYQTEEAQLLQSRIDAFKENETKINNASEVIGQAFAKGQSLDQFLLETGADAEEFSELRDSLLNQDDPEKGRLFREAMAMHELATGERRKAGPADTLKLGSMGGDGTTEAARVGIVNNEIRISPIHVWDANSIKSEINALDISNAKKRTAIASIPRMQEEAAKLELPFLQKVNEFNAFVKKNNLQGDSPKNQISEWKSRTRNWSEMITKAPAQVGIGLTQGALGLLEAGQAIVGGTAMTMGAQKFADPFLDAATQTSERNQELGRISQEIGGPTLLAELAAVAPQIALQIGIGKTVSFGGTKLGLKPKMVSNLGFGSSVGTAMAQSYGGVLSSAFQQLEKEKIDGGMDPIQARAEAIKEAQLPAALSGLSTAIVTAIGGKRGVEAPFREGVAGIRAKLNTAAFRAELPRLIPDVIKGMRNEGYEELADQLAQGIIEQFTFNPELSTSDIINNAVKALVIGGITGGTVEGLKYGFDYMRAPKEMARREASMASIRQSITDAEKDISAASASSPIGSEFQREYDATLPSDEAAKLGAIAVDRTKMSSLQAERQELAELLEDETISRVARNQLEGKLAAADVAYYNEVLAPMRRNVVNEQLVDQLDGMAVSQQTKDSIVALSKIANGLGAESLTGRERVAVGITSIGEGRFLASKKNPMVEIGEDGQATVTEAGRLMAENVGMVPLVRMIGLSESTRAKQAEMERIVAELAEKKAQQEAKDTAESEDAKRYGPASAEALKQQVAAQPTVPETQSNARLAQLLKEQEEAARLGEEAVARAVETRFIESFRSTMSESIVPTMERAATIDLNAFQDVINGIAREIDKGAFNIELIEQGEFKNILPESAFTTVVEAFKENPQRALNALRAFGDEVENAVKEFGGGAAGEPPENLEPLRRVVRTEQTPEDVAALTEAGLIEIYKDQPVLTQAGIDALPEAERPRLNPEARKIQIDTGSNEVVAEAISKGLRIGVDQVGPNVTMPQGWTLDGDIYIPPAPVTEPPVTPLVQPPVDELVTIFNYDERVKPIQDQIDNRIDELEAGGMTFEDANKDPSVIALYEQRYAMDSSAINSYRDIVNKAFSDQGITNDNLGFTPASSISNSIYGAPSRSDEGLISRVYETGQRAFNDDKATIKKLSEAIFKYRAENEGLDPEGLLGPSSGLGNAGKQARVDEARIAAETIHNQIKNSMLGKARVQPPVAPPVTPPPIAPIAGAITEEQANKAVKAAQKERAKKNAPTIEKSDWGPKSVPTKIIAGGTARQALITASRLNLSKIAQSNPNEIMMQDVAAILAELDMPILDLESVATLSSLKAKGRPRRWPGIGSVIGMPSTIPMPVKTLVHELGHTLTADQIRRYLPRKKTGSGKAYLDALNKAIADPKTPEAVSRLFSLYVSTIDQLGITEQYFGKKGVAGTPRADTSKAMAKRLQAKGLLRKDLKGDSLYGFANVEEFVSQTFSETPFRDLLKTLKDPTNPQRTLWQAFVDAIQAILQLPKGSMAAGVIQASVDVGMTVPSDRELGGRKKGTAPAPAAAPYPSIGININDAGQNFTEQIIAGDKTIETRDTDSLRPYVGKRVGIVRTGVGPATLVGYATIGEPVVYNNATEFRADQDKHLVAEGSQFDIKAGGFKYGYPLTDIEEVSPTIVSPKGNWIVARRIPQPVDEADAAPESETGRTVEMSLEMEKERTFQLLGERLYTAELPKVVVKETVQNGFDAIKDAEETGEISRGSGVIAYSRNELEVNGQKIVRMMFSDNGGGMTPEILQNAFFTVGGTFKRSGKGSGGFGLAKLGMFMSADRVMVETVRDGVVTTADLTKQELVDKKFNVNVAEDANRKNGTMVILEFKKSITRSDGKTVEFENPYTSFDRLIHHDLTVIDDGYGSYQDELIGLFQNKQGGMWSLDEIIKSKGKKPYTFEDFVKDAPNVETFEQDFVIAGAKKPIKVRVASSRLGFKGKDGKTKWNEDVQIAGATRNLKNHNMSVYSNGLFQFEKDNLKIDPMKLWGGDPLPYNIVVDIDAGGLDAASLAYPFTNSREDFQNGVVKDYINKLLNDIRVKERLRQFDQEFNLLTDISGGKPRKDSPTLYNNTTIVPQPFEQKFLEDLTKAVFDVADDLVVALRKGNEDNILEDDWYKVKSQKGSVAPTGKSQEDVLDYFYGVGISKNWGGVNTSRDPVSVLVNPIYEERVDEYAKTEFGRRILARTIAKTLIHEINHHLHRNEGSDFTFFILQNEAYLGEVGAIQSAVDKILPIVNQYSDAIISLKNKFRTAETKDTDNELTGEQYERSSKEADGQPRTTIVGGNRVVQQSSTEVSARPTSEEDGEQTGAYLPSSITAGGRKDTGIGEGISFGEALSKALVENQAQTTEGGVSLAQQDSDHLTAVESGDTKTAQRLTDEIAAVRSYQSQNLLFHGTTHIFNVFRKDRTNVENDFGKGYYLTNTEADAQINYAGEGPDLTNRIERLSEQLQDNDNLDEAEARKKATEILSGGGQRIMRVYVRLENPFNVGGTNETFLDYNLPYNETTEEYGEPTGKLAEFLDALRPIIESYSEDSSVDADKAVGNIIEYVVDRDGISASDLVRILKQEDSGIIYANDENGDSAMSEIIRQAIEDAGFDGVVDNLVNQKFGGAKKIGKAMAGMGPDTVHTIVFDSSQIKSADAATYDDDGNLIPLSRRFLAEEGDVRFSPEEEFDIVPEQVEDQIEGTPEAAVIKVMGQAFQMANEQSATAGTPQGTIPLETITSAWMNSGRDVETLENAIIRYTNLDPEVAATLAEAISQQVEIQRGIMDIADAARSRKAEQDEEPEIKPYSFAERIKGELPAALRKKVDLVYEVLRNEVSVQEANQAMSGLTVDEAIRATEDMKNGISFPVRSMMVQIVLRKIMAQRRATKGKRGKEADYEAAVEAHVNFFNFTNDYFKELGQGVQAIARFSDLGADGILLKVRKDVDKAISKHITNRRGQIDKIKRDVEEADSAAFKAALNANKNSMDSTADKAGKQEAKIVTIEEQAQKLAQRAAKKVAGEEVRRRQPDPLSELVNGHLRRYNANFVAEATAMGVSPVTAQAIEDSAIKLRDSRQSAKAERERFKDMQDERMKVKKELARENKYIYGERPTIWEDYQEMFSERLARRLMRDPKKKIPPSLLLFTDRLTENLLGFVPEAKRQATTQRSFQAMIEDALNNKEKYQEAFSKAMEDISLKVMELEARAGGGEAVSSSAYKKALAAQEFMERLEPIIQQFPVSDKLIIRFVNQKTKAIGESITAKYNQWYRSSKKTRSEIEMELAQKLVEDINVSDSDALKLSRAIIKDFRAKAEERREKALARFKKPKEKSKRLKESPLKTFFELVNIGAMTDKDAYAIMAHRFELPTWDAKFAKQIEDMALIIQDMPEGLDRRKMTRNLMAEIARRKGFSMSDLGAGFAYSNMLSSIETFLINLQDTLFNNWFNGFANSIADKDFTRMSGLLAGYKKGWQEAVQVFNTGLRINMPRLEEKTPLTVELTNYGYKGGVALESTEGMNAIAKTLLESPPARALNLWKYVTRIMEATDAINYVASSEGQRYAEAAKMAKDEGLEGKEKRKRINQILNLGDDVYQAALKQAEQEGYTGADLKFRAMEIQDGEIDGELRERAFDRALVDVYRNMPTGLAGFLAAKFNSGIMAFPNSFVRNALKLVTAPFVITPTNVFNKWLDWSPYGYKRLFLGSGNLFDKDGPYYVAPPKVGSAEFWAQTYKASSSVLVMIMAEGLIRSGLLVLNGMGPFDEEERKQWLDDGNRPHTFSFMGGPQFSYQYTPWALPLSWMANVRNWSKYEASKDVGLADRALVGLFSVTSVIMDLPFFAGPADLLNFLQSKRSSDITTSTSKYIEGKMGMVFPNFIRHIDRIFDPTIYDSRGIKGIILDQTPFARRLGTQRVNLFGDPIGEDKPTMDRLIGRIVSSPVNPSRESRILAKYDIYPYMPSPQRARALVDGEEAQMTEEQYNKFVKIVGTRVKQDINSLFDPEGEVSETEMKLGKKRISQIFEKARARGVREVSY